MSVGRGGTFGGVIVDVGFDVDLEYFTESKQLSGSLNFRQRNANF